MSGRSLASWVCRTLRDISEEVESVVGSVLVDLHVGIGCSLRTVLGALVRGCVKGCAVVVARVPGSLGHAAPAPAVWSKTLPASVGLRHDDFGVWAGRYIGFEHPRDC